MINLAKGWIGRFGPEKPTDKSKQRKVMWATTFPSCLQLSQKEKALQPEAAIVYKRPPTIGALITNYKKASFSIKAKTFPRKVNLHSVNIALFVAGMENTPNQWCPAQKFCLQILEILS